MSDFYQTGVVANLHRLGRANGQIESELEVFGKQRPIALVLPALYSEFESGALHRIIQELTEISYLRQIILTLGGSDAGQFSQARDYIAKLPQQVRIIWNDGPQVSGLFQMLEENDLRIGPPGKGRACWIAYGYVLASQQSDIIHCVHDSLAEQVLPGSIYEDPWCERIPGTGQPLSQLKAAALFWIHSWSFRDDKGCEKAAVGPRRFASPRIRTSVSATVFPSRTP